MSFKVLFQPKSLSDGVPCPLCFWLSPGLPPWHFHPRWPWGGLSPVTCSVFPEFPFQFCSVGLSQGLISDLLGGRVRFKRQWMSDVLVAPLFDLGAICASNALYLNALGRRNGFTTQMKSGAGCQVSDILAFLLVSKIYSADFCRTQVRVHWITAASQRLLTGVNGIVFLHVIFIGGGSSVFITNLLQKLFTVFHLLHWPVNTENERELINCHLSEFSTKCCLHLPPHQPLCSKIVRKILGFYSCLL